MREADAVLHQAHHQRRQLFDLADRLVAAERGGRWEAERQLWDARLQASRCRNSIAAAQRTGRVNVGLVSLRAKRYT